jgi:hypothetical protein
MPPVRSARERAEYKQFVKEAVDRYGPGGSFWLLNPGVPRLPIDVWQFGNEPNLPFFFGGKVGVRRFRALLKASARAVRSRDPKARVLTGGIFRYRTVRGSVSMKKYLKRLYRLKGARKWFDAVGVHPYSPRPGGVIATIKAARGIMNRAHDRRTPIWVTEFGWTVGGVGWKQNAFRATKRQQAKRLRWSYKLMARKRGLKVKRAFWHSFKDLTTAGRPDPWTDRMGLLTLKGKRRPAWYAYARVAGGTP